VLNTMQARPAIAGARQIAANSDVTGERSRMRYSSSADKAAAVASTQGVATVADRIRLSCTPQSAYQVPGADMVS
jgi:hypothetical protein